MQPKTESAKPDACDPAKGLKRHGRSISWPKKLIFGCVAASGFLLILEAALALLGVHPSAQTDDLLVGFSRQAPLMDASQNEAGQWYLQTAPSKLVWFNPQSFPLKKPTDTKRIICVGGSTTFGRPFDDVSSYSGWLRELLPLVDRSTDWEVINAGGVSYASYRVAAVMAELSQYQPDLFIVYSAHNEFLERRTHEGLFETSPIARDIQATLQKTRTGSLIRKLLAGNHRQSTSASDLLPAEVDEILNHSVGPLDYHVDEDWHDDVLRNYELNLERMIAIARQAGAAIVFVTPASNLRDCSPFKSETKPDLSDAAVAKLREFVDQANLDLAEERFDDALKACRASLAIDARHAEARYLLGRALFSLGRFEEAEDALKKSVDDDVCPLRATSRISQAVRRVAKTNRVPLVDFETQLREQCQSEFGHGCVGGEYFLDHVHPNLNLHGQLARWILAELQSQSLVGGQAPSDAQIGLVGRGIDQQIDADGHGMALRNLAKVLHWSGKFSEAAPRARDALALMPTDLESRFVLADCLFNMHQPDDAFDQYELLATIGDFPRAYLPYGEMLADRDRLEEAKGYLLQAIVVCRDANRARAYFALGSVHCMLGEYKLALEALEEANRLYPGDPTTMILLAEANTGAGKLTQGLDLLQQVIDLDPNNYTAHYRLGMMLLGERRIAKARKHIEIAVRIDPDDNRAIQVLETIRLVARAGEKVSSQQAAEASDAK